MIAYLRENEITLTYDPAAGTLRAGTGGAAQTIIRKQANPGSKARYTKGERKKNAGRPALAAASARVTIRHARKPEDMGI